MQLISSNTGTTVELLPPLHSDFIETESANDTCDRVGRDPYLKDLNQLVTHLTGNVVRAVGSKNLRVDLMLNPSIHDYVAAPDLISFVVGGVLTTQLRTCSESDNGRLFVSTEVDGNETVVTVLANDVPPLAAVRAIAEKLGIARASGADSILLHCREIVEAMGGRIELCDDVLENQALLGFELRIPTVPHCNSTGLLAPAPLVRTSTEHDYCMTGS